MVGSGRRAAVARQLRGRRGPHAAAAAAAVAVPTARRHQALRRQPVPVPARTL